MLAQNMKIKKYFPHIEYDRNRLECPDCDCEKKIGRR